MVKSILIVTLIIELTGAVILSLAFLKYFPPLKALWYGTFHSISAFCNAGIDLFGRDFYAYSSLIPFQHDKIVLMTIALLIILGGLGFTVILDVSKQRDLRRLSLHSKLALITTSVFILAGFVFFFLTESNTTFNQLGLADRLTNAFFLGVTPRTAGYTAVDLSQVLPATLLGLMFLMFVGASPAGTGGGIKTTTFAVLVLAAKSRLRTKRDLVVYHRRIDHETESRAFTVTVISSAMVFICIVILSLVDSHDLVKLMFEAFSAFGTVGLSTGITPSLSDGGKIVIILLMFFGRLGPLTLAFALMENNVKAEQLKFPRGNVIIG